MTRISFLVPTYNRAGYLGEALAAIVSQTQPEDEVLVIDDGSSDSTPEVVATFAPRVRYVRQDNAGKSAALNRGLAQTDGTFVWICDDDDVLRPDAVTALTAALEDRAVQWAFARYTRFRDDGTGERRDLGTGYWPDLTSGAPVRHILEDGFVMQNAALVRRSAYAAVGPFSTAMARSLDYEMFVRLAVAFPCAWVDTIAFEQRKHAGDRGPAKQRHAEGRSDEVWRRFDQRIFENLHRFAPLQFFAGMFECRDEEQLRRAALVQRAAIMLRHDCLNEGLADLAAAANQATVPLDPGEVSICKRVLAGKNNPAPLWSQGLGRSLRDLAAGSSAGRQIVEAILLGARWRVRRDPDRRWSNLRGMIAAGGLNGAVRSFSRPNAAPRRARVIERDALAHDAWIAPRELRPVADL